MLFSNSTGQKPEEEVTLKNKKNNITQSVEEEKNAAIAFGVTSALQWGSTKNEEVAARIENVVKRCSHNPSQFSSFKFLNLTYLQVVNLHEGLVGI